MRDFDISENVFWLLFWALCAALLVALGCAINADCKRQDAARDACTAQHRSWVQFNGHPTCIGSL